VTKLIEKDDPRFFEQTSDKPYDRHIYKLVFNDKYAILDSWEEVQEYWWNNRAIVRPVIEVLDKPKKKSKGFN
tara:strand:- start:36 stop:254 length:219 start_codon:yes stop_codon:yes gene_type:complete